MYINDVVLYSFLFLYTSCYDLDFAVVEVEEGVETEAIMGENYFVGSRESKRRASWRYVTACCSCVRVGA